MRGVYPANAGKPYSHHDLRGTILNKERDLCSTTGRRCVSVRWDNQHPWEKGHYVFEDELVSDKSGGNDFDRRKYELFGLSGDHISLMRDVLANDPRPAAVDLLRRLPVLP